MLGGIWLELREEWEQELCICYYKSHQNQKSMIVYMIKYSLNSNILIFYDLVLLVILLIT